MGIGWPAVRLMAMAVLVLGMVAMHHVARSEHGGSGHSESSAAIDHVLVAEDSAASASGATDGEAPSFDHGLLHLCLAVMTAVAVLFVGCLLLAWRPWVSVPASVAFRARPMPSRSPPRRHGSALLMSLCVMRT